MKKDKSNNNIQNIMKKKFGGTITDWQFNTVTNTPESLKLAKEHYPTFNMDGIYMMTGTVEEDKLGRWLPGYHMRSTVVLSYNKSTKIVETLNTLYKVTDNEGDPTFGCKDAGMFVTQLYY